MPRIPAPKFNITRNLANLLEVKSSRMLEQGFNPLQSNINVFKFSQYVDYRIQNQYSSSSNNVAGTKNYYVLREFRFHPAIYKETLDRRWNIQILRTISTTQGHYCLLYYIGDKYVVVQEISTSSCRRGLVLLTRIGITLACKTSRYTNSSQHLGRGSCQNQFKKTHCSYACMHQQTRDVRSLLQRSSAISYRSHVLI